MTNQSMTINHFNESKCPICWTPYVPPGIHDNLNNSGTLDSLNNLDSADTRFIDLACKHILCQECYHSVDKCPLCHHTFSLKILDGLTFEDEQTKEIFVRLIQNAHRGDQESRHVQQEAVNFILEKVANVIKNNEILTDDIEEIAPFKELRAILRKTPAYSIDKEYLNDTVNLILTNSLFRDSQIELDRRLFLQNMTKYTQASGWYGKRVIFWNLTNAEMYRLHSFMKYENHYSEGHLNPIEEEFVTALITVPRKPTEIFSTIIYYAGLLAITKLAANEHLRNSI